eukprot:6176180-Pleurochrysis_carterae.AAC.1
MPKISKISRIGITDLGVGLDHQNIHHPGGNICESGLGHLNTAWPVLRAVNGLRSLLEHAKRHYKAFRCFGTQSITDVAAYEPVYSSRGPSLACLQPVLSEAPTRNATKSCPAILRTSLSASNQKGRYGCGLRLV